MFLARKFEAGAGGEADARVERPIPGEERLVESAIAVGRLGHRPPGVTFADDIAAGTGRCHIPLSRSRVEGAGGGRGDDTLPAGFEAVGGAGDGCSPLGKRFVVESTEWIGGKP